MNYNVVVTDGVSSQYENQLVFTFSSITEAIIFTKHILNISDYNIEIIQISENEE